MRHLPILLFIGLAGCTQAQLASFQSGKANVVAEGQLFCAEETATGPLVVALADVSGAPVTATGKASSVVSAACAVINAVPVSPPPVPVQAPVVAAPVTVLDSGVTKVGS